MVLFVMFIFYGNVYHKDQSIFIHNTGSVHIS